MANVVELLAVLAAGFAMVFCVVKLECKGCWANEHEPPDCQPEELTR